MTCIGIDCGRKSISEVVTRKTQIYKLVTPRLLLFEGEFSPLPLGKQWTVDTTGISGGTTGRLDIGKLFSHRDTEHSRVLKRGQTLAEGQVLKLTINF